MPVATVYIIITIPITYGPHSWIKNICYECVYNHDELKRIHFSLEYFSAIRCIVIRL